MSSPHKSPPSSFELQPQNSQGSQSSQHHQHHQHSSFPESLPARQPRRPANRGNIYPTLSPNRPLYLIARLLAVTFSTALIVLATVALTALPKNRGEWSAPILSPAISTLFGSSIELWTILKYNRRSHHFYRLLYDAALGIGYLIAFGFLIKFTSADIRRTKSDSTAASAGVGVAILMLMFVEFLLQMTFSFSGFREWRRIQQSS